MNLKMKHLMTACRLCCPSDKPSMHRKHRPQSHKTPSKLSKPLTVWQTKSQAGSISYPIPSERSAEKSEEWSKDATTYKDQLKEQWPSIKEQFNQKLSEGMEKGQQSKEADFKMAG